MNLNPDQFVRAVDCLMRPDNLGSLKRIRETISKDPDFLTYHSASVSLDIIRMLLKDPASSTIPYDSDLIIRILREALKKLDSKR